ncbi:aspartate/glutamate racemase family protein [Pandoraea fibrosis]|uniref:Aspartate/glutamate racemase family protein n=1 Tax=Pandoraea fibrosis TaxID=1891094 RepID=A0A5E4VHY7_9BURK|nr:aspartate/glutamate racemase family protein [Pandoraea fibrosis]VVE11019.1 hypothetical protein PFI31113_02605 [Pandoraea fibrosis]
MKNSTDEHVRKRVVHGVTLGILMLDTGFERLPGDIGHASTWDFPVQYALVKGVTGPQVMSPGAGGSLDRFVEAAHDLVALGVDGITTSCGFLAAYQSELQARCPVPIATSSLLQIPMISRVLPFGKRVGVLTARREAMTPAHLSQVGAPLDLPIAGLRETSHFFNSQLHNAASADPSRNFSDLLGCAQELLAAHPDVGAIVSECTNFSPYSAALADTLKIPVFDIVSMIEWFHYGLRPKRFHTIHHERENPSPPTPPKFE